MEPMAAVSTEEKQRPSPERSHLRSQQLSSLWDWLRGSSVTWLHVPQIKVTAGLPPLLYGSDRYFYSFIFWYQGLNPRTLYH